MSVFIENNLNIEKLVSPSPLFKIFNPSQDKTRVFAEKLVNEFLYMPDEDRNYEVVWRIIVHMMNEKNNLIYEIGDFGGLIAFTNIIPFYKCTLSFKLWDRDIWGRDFVRQAKSLIYLIKDGLALFRVGTSTADPKIVRMAKMAGFDVEGRKRANFSFDGTLYDEYIMSIVSNPDEERKMIKMRKK